MKVITDKELDDTTVQIKCGENYGTAFLINENTAITVKHCLYNPFAEGVPKTGSLISLQSNAVL